MNKEEPSSSESPALVDCQSTEQKSDIRVSISPDGRQALLTLTAIPPEPYPFTPETVSKAIEDRGVVWGILTEELREIVNQEQYVSDRVVALGQDPVEGENARIEFLFDPSPKPYSLEETEERIDWHDVRLIQAVSADQPVARKIPARSGQPGTTVTGKKIEPRKVNDARLPVGRGTKVDANDPSQLVAAEPGCVSLTSNQVVVNKVLTVTRDVDFSVGNINLDGSVQVSGNLLPGFQVRATGDVHISGYVEAATIEAGGSVWISKGVLGHNKTTVRAAHHVQVKFASNAVITAGGDITVQGEVVNCQLESGGTISVGTREGTRSRIVGGKLSAAKAIHTVDLGSEGGAATTLSVAQEAIAAFLRKEREVMDRLAVRRSNHAAINSEIARVMKQQRSSGETNPDQSSAQMLNRLATAAGQIEEEILGIEAQLAESKAEITKLVNPKVVVNGTLFPGVHVTIGQWTRSFRDKMTRVQLVADRDNSAVKVLAL